MRRWGDLLVAPITLAVLGAGMLALTLGLSVASLHVRPSFDDPVIHCGSLIAPHHFPDATYQTEESASFAKGKCHGERTKRAHRAGATGLLGVGLCIGAVVLRRRDRLVASRARQELVHELSALKE